MAELIEISDVGDFLGLGVRHKRRKKKAKKSRKGKKRRVRAVKRKTKKAKRPKMTAKRRTGEEAPRHPAPKSVPLRRLKTHVRIATANKAQVRRQKATIRRASIKKALGGIRLSMIALANGRFDEAGTIALNAAIDAVASFKENPQMAVRIIRTARGVVKHAVRHKRRNTL